MRKYVGGAAIAVLAIGLTACSSGGSSDSAAGAGSSSASCIKVDDSALIEPGTLNIGTNATLPPLSYQDADGTLKGQRIDLGKAIAAKLCLTAKFTNAQATTLQPSMQAHRIDMIDIGFFVTADRTKVMRMLPTEQMGIGISTVKGNPDKITSLKDLAGKTVAGAKSSYEEKLLQTISDQQVAEGLQPIKIQSFDEYDLVFQALSAGQVDAAVTTSPVAKYYSDKGGFSLAVNNVQPTDTSLTFNGDNGALADAVKQALDAMKADGSYDKLISEYGLTAVDSFQVLWTGSNT